MTPGNFQRLLTICDTSTQILASCTQILASTRKYYSQVTRKWLAGDSQVLATVNNCKCCSWLASLSQVSRRYLASRYMCTSEYILYWWPLRGCNGDGSALISCTVVFHLIRMSHITPDFFWAWINFFLDFSDFPKIFSDFLKVKIQQNSTVLYT